MLRHSSWGGKIVRLLCLTAVPACCVLAWSDAAAVCTAVRELGHGNWSGFEADRGCDPAVAPPDTGCAGQDMVITNEADWDALWGMHISNMCEPWTNPTCDCYVEENCPCCVPWTVENHHAPPVNFNTEVVLATFLGRRRTTGFNTSITCVQYTTTMGGFHPHADVTVLDRKAGGTCNVQFAFTNWYHFVAAPRTTSLIQQQQQQSQSFTFQHQLQVLNCGDNPNCNLCYPGQAADEFGPPCCH